MEERPPSARDPLVRRAQARIGLLGNPSDGYFGKVISFTLADLFAEVRITSADVIRILPHPQHDSIQHATLQQLCATVDARGYSGGVQLLLATCHTFSKHCRQHSIPIQEAGFEMSYESNIPRQSGLSGSSAIVVAALTCLIDFHKVSDRIPRKVRPGLALGAEEELGITAGLQDRVVQVYGGLVYMDFEQEHMHRCSCGRYEKLDAALLPPFWLIYAQNPKQSTDSGKVHSNVRERWLRGEASICALMAEIAALAEEGRSMLLGGNFGGLGKLMDRNFDLRRQVFGDSILGESNIQMVELVRSTGGSAKFTGSGGAVVALFPFGDAGVAAVARARKLCQEEGFNMVKAEVVTS